MLLALGSILIPTIGATSSIFEPLTGITDPEKYYSVYLKPDGSMRADSIRIPIVSSGYGGSIYGGIEFYNITIDQNALINNATLSLYFLGDLESSSSALTMRVYGMLDALAMGATLSGLDRGNPTTINYVDVTLTGITSAQWVNITVTDIVSEINSLYGWESGDSLGFIIYGSEADTARSYQSNIGANYPMLYVTYNETEEQGATIYKDYIIEYVQPTSSNPNIVGYAYDTQYFSAPLYKNYCNFWTDIPLGGGNYSYTAGLHMTGGATEGYQQYLVINQTIYALNLNNSATDIDIQYSNDYGVTWTRLGTVCDLGATLSPDSYAMGTVDNEYITIVFTSGDGSGGNIYYTSYNLTSGSGSARYQLYGSNYAVQNKPTLFWDNQTQLWYCSFYGGTAGGSTSATKIYPFFETNYSTPLGMVYEELTTTGANSEIFRWDSHTLICVERKSNSVEGIRIWNMTSPSTNVWSLLNTLDDDSLDLKFSDAIIGYDNESVKCLLIGFTAVIAGDNNPAYYISYDGGVTYETYVYSDRNLDFRGASLFNYNGTIWMAFIEYTNFDIYLWAYDDIDDTDADYQFIIPDTPNSQCDEIHIADYPEGEAAAGYWKVTPPPDGTPPNPDCLAAATTLEDVEACIDTVIPVSGDDPSPPGWDEEGGFTRGRVKLYFFLIGLAMIFLPLYFVIGARGAYNIIRYVWIMLLCWVIGLGLLWSIPYI